MKCAVDMGSFAMVYVPGFIKIGSGIQRLLGRIHRHTGGKVISYARFNFFQNKESRLIMDTFHGKHVRFSTHP
jgi:hypothetical protein